MLSLMLVSLLITVTTTFAGGNSFGNTWFFSDGSTWAVSGEITSVDMDGTPHGCGTITVTDKDGNSISWDYTFSYHIDNDDPIGQRMFALTPQALGVIDQYINQQVMRIMN